MTDMNSFQEEGIDGTITQICQNSQDLNIFGMNS